MLLHPFLILPLVGAGILGKIAWLKGGLSRILLCMVIAIICFGLYGYCKGTVNIQYKRNIYRVRGDWNQRLDRVNHAMPLMRGGIGVINRVIGNELERNQFQQARNLIPVDPGARIFLDIFAPMGGLPPIIEVNNNKATDVHDHDIQTSLKLGISKLDAWYKTIDVPLTKEQTLKQIKEFIFDKYEGKYEEKEKAYNAVRIVEKSNGRLSSINKTELDVLLMVWQRIRDPVNKAVADELKNNLLGSLSDSIVSTYNSYCLVGRITRIVQSLQSLDIEHIVNIKSKDVIEKEIQGRIPILISDYFSINKNEQEAYDNGDNNVARGLQAFVKEQLSMDYKDTDVIASHNKLVDSYLNELV
jgi:hypothetical protein